MSSPPRMRITLFLVDPQEEITVDIDARDRRALELAARGLGLETESLTETWNRYPETATTYVAWHAACRSNSNLGSYQACADRTIRTQVHTDEDGGESGLTDPMRQGQ